MAENKTTVVSDITESDRQKLLSILKSASGYTTEYKEYPQKCPMDEAEFVDISSYKKLVKLIESILDRLSDGK